MAREMILYTTVGCHLCEQAEGVIKAVVNPSDGDADQLRKVDIADSPELMERYGIRIPVLQLGDTGAELGWPFDEARLREFLRQAGS